MSIKIKFCGAAGTVTGSCFLIKAENCQFLVDCGLFQGSKTIKELNYRSFPFDPRQIDFVLLTHAHTDHAALVPKLIKGGFKGPVYATPATRDLLNYMLPDSGYIQEMEVKRLNQRNRQRGRPSVVPIYTRDEAEMAINRIKTNDYEEWYEPFDGFRARFWNAGHILGSASIEIEIQQENKWLRLLFSGDLGHGQKVLHDAPEAPTNFDYVICEATYGGRTRNDVSVKKRRGILAREIKDAMKAGGNLVIPSFAVERSQELLLDIAYLLRAEIIPCSAVFLDSPLAIRITSVFSHYAAQLNNTGDGVTAFTHPNFHFTETVEESKSINAFNGGAIIMAASGMCDAGRIRHHLKNHLWDPKSTILLVGYQATGTLGSLMERGAKNVKIQGEDIHVRARIRTLDIYSGHADNDGLINWMKNRQPINQGVFLIHGSEQSLHDMREGLIKENFNAKNIFIPAIDDEFELNVSGKALRAPEVDRRLDPNVIDKPDWHNELAQLTLDIRRELEEAPDNEAKVRILKHLKRIVRPDSNKN